jgi:cyclic beta-1,2-glucan synthetase
VNAEAATDAADVQRDTPHAEVPCPGLEQDVRWDEADALRGPILSPERLTEHAKKLAHFHGEPSSRVTPGPLRARFAAARARVREAYEMLLENASEDRDPSPAEEWLLDNSHVVYDQIREIREDLPWGYLVKLPRLSSGAMRGYPRVYGLCLDYLRHSDARIELETLSSYVLAYQSVHTLTIGELWAVPIMLRMGLVLSVGTLVASEAVARDRADGEQAAKKLYSAARDARSLESALRELERRAPFGRGFLVELARRAREQDTAVGVINEWIRARCAEMDTTPEELTRQYHLQQAADQVWVGNAITSMRAVSALDWNSFFEATSVVEASLSRDPAGAYVASDDRSRDACRHAVEQLARRSRVSEEAVAREALALAEREKQDHPDDPARSHVGYYLVDEGRRELAKRVGYRPRPAEHLRNGVLRAPAFFYLSGITVATLVFAAAATLAIGADGPLFWVLAALVLLPASELAVTLVNALVVALLPPRVLSKLEFEEGVPREHRTLVAVPALLDSVSTLQRLLEDLEVRSLANPDEELTFALLTDFVDADAPERPEDTELLELALHGVAALNRRFPGRVQHRYVLMHRKRVLNQSEGRHMGWERKRGKLEELNRLLRGARDTTFEVVSAPIETLTGIRYVITLDADTELPRGVARRLVGALAHPLNQPVFDARKQRVVRGHGIIQPRVGTLPESARRSAFARIFAGRAGIDPYTTAVSDVYQDLFGEGSFVGKAIYDVDAVTRSLEGRVPENTLLSHDLFEGIFARSALATDIEVLDDQPASYAVVAGRAHRWVRGDWQLLPWLLPRVPSARGRRKNDLRLLDAWKILDNLRRSLVPPALVTALALVWWAVPARAAFASLSLVVLFLAPILGRAVFALTRTKGGFSLLEFAIDLKNDVLQALVSIALLLDHALVLVDATLRTLYRVLVSRKHLLEWTTTSQAERLHARKGQARSPRSLFGSGLAFLGVAMLARFSTDAFAGAAPVLVAWIIAPALAGYLSRPEEKVPVSHEVDAKQRVFLRRIARKTWRFFTTYVTERDNFLPPDNWQEDPRGVVAHRTSPTNIGLYLLSVIAARDFGFVTLREVVQRLDRTLATLVRMEKREGHILNWYDTVSLRPLEPQYVSTVDSGNLAGYLWTLQQTCRELVRRPLFGREALDAVTDALRLALAPSLQSMRKRHTPKNLEVLLDELTEAADAPFDPAASVALLSRTAETLRASRLTAFSEDASHEARYYLDQAIECAEAWLSELDAFQPYLEWLKSPPPSLMTGFLGELLIDIRERLRAAASLEQITAAVTEVAPLCRNLTAQLENVKLSSEEREVVNAYIEELERRLDVGVRTALECSVELDALGKTAGEIADGMNFSFLYDTNRKLMAIGYNVGAARLDGSHYDLLASEARLASIVAIAKGDVPEEHWFRLGRPRTAATAGRLLLSWSGSMFEYLMPLLVTKSSADTLLAESYDAVVRAQVLYGKKHGGPWGVSEAAYNVMDLGMTYQYRAFGVPGLGLKAGLAEDLVIAPYATVLAALVRPRDAIENLERLSREGLESLYGYYESVDYTPMHVPPGRRGVIVKAYMAHHQGMSLVALDNLLNDGPMQRRFHTDARIKATELLLEERIPLGAPVVELHAATIRAPLLVEPELEAAEHVGLATHGPLRSHLLGHGELSTFVTYTGGGFTTYKGRDVNRFRADSVLEPGGIYGYVRHVDDERYWSVTFDPVRKKPDAYDVTFTIDRVEFRRRDENIETLMELVVSPEYPAEVRRFTLANHGDEPAQLELTTYTEVALSPRRSDAAHPAFANMFVETEAFTERGALLARRRPRLPGEPETWLVQLLVPEEGEWTDFEWDTSRENFIGRGRTLADPAALDGEGALAGTQGSVLDPALSLRRRVRLAPGERRKVALVTGLAESRTLALELLEAFAAAHSVQRSFELGWADARVELRHLGITAVQSHRFQRLLGAMLFPHPALRPSIAPVRPPVGGLGALWAEGISGDLPILLLRVDDPGFSELCRELLLAQEFFRLNGVELDLVIVNEEPAGYLMPLQEALLSVIQSSPAAGHLNQRGGVFLRRGALLSPEAHDLLERSASVVLSAAAGSLSQQLHRAARTEHALPRPRPGLGTVRERPKPEPPVLPELQLANGIGGFADGGREYVLTAGTGAVTPAPWCNVLANASFGSVISERGSAYTWFESSQQYRLSPWHNDALRDTAGEAIYVRDDDSGAYWSATPAPAPAGARYLVRHGQGYTKFEHRRGGLTHELSVFVSATDSVKFLRLRVKNDGKVRRRLSVWGIVEWVLGSNRESMRSAVATTYDAPHAALFAEQPLDRVPGRRAFLASTKTPRSVSGDREEFYGRLGSRSEPEALGRIGLSGRVGPGLDPCAALEVALGVEPGETAEVTFLLGAAESREEATALVNRLRTDEAVTAAFHAVLSFWDDVLGRVTIETPDPALDALMNRWLLYQVLACRLWARSGYYQSGGAYGFRDQLQDVLALIHSRPELAREHIVRASARQFEEGDVQHWWHPATGQGVRTRCSDDLVWLPFVVAEYVRATGDRALLDERAPFLIDRELEPAEEDAFGVPRVSAEVATVYEHCARACERALQKGPHDLPVIGTCDWNDGMNRVGHEGRGESIWLAWFLGLTLKSFGALSLSRGDAERAASFRAEAQRLAVAVEREGWDGSWYRRAYFDDGTPIGSKDAAECRIDAIAQSWAVISGLGDPERARTSLYEAIDRLVKPELRIMQLLDPPFTGAGPNPGYIAAYPPGVRENGGQYTHGVLWSLQALCQLGDAEGAGRLLSLLNPVYQADSPEGVARYRVEPYVLAADIYSVEPHAGRGGWTWYTGSASWMYRIVLEYVLGVRREGDALRVQPCAPPGFGSFRVRYRHEGGELDLTFEQVENEQGVSIELDGQPLRGLVPLPKDHRSHQARVRFGTKKPAPRAALPRTEEDVRRFKKLG